MNRKSDPRKRRPRSRRDEPRDSADAKERIEKEFAREIEMRIGYFLESDEDELELEPMNSYRRRLVHNIAKNFNLASESRGEDRERYVTLLKTEETQAPPTRRTRLWDYGSQTFHVNPGDKGVHMALKIDGSVELFNEHDRKNVAFDRVVTGSEFRVRKGRIVEPGEPGY